MIVTIAPMVYPNICEPPYLLEALELIKNEISDEYHFIIARTNSFEEIKQFKECIRKDKKNISIILSDEAGVKPYFLDELFLVFRTYSNTLLYDNKKIHAIPCGYSCGYGGLFGKNDWVYKNIGNKSSLNDREYDIFYSGQLSLNRISMKYNLDKIKDSFKSNINYTDGFARGHELKDYYDLMQNSKIAIVPTGAVVPESFRYFEAFESNCIVITNYPIKNEKYNNWFYEESPAIFLDDWRELNEELVKTLLLEENLVKYDNMNRKYFEDKISTKALSRYILNIIKKND